MPVRVLWISDSPHLPTGFGRVTWEVLRRLGPSTDLDIHVLALGAPYAVYDPDDYPFTLWPHPGAVTNGGTVSEVVATLRPDVVVTYCDLWLPEYMLPVIEQHPVSWIGYFPIDAGPLPGCFRRLLEPMSARVTTSCFSAEVFKSSFPDLEVHVVKHGVDSKVFRPRWGLSAKQKAPNGEDAFVVGCVARNQPRKGIPILVEAFAMLARRYDDVMLYLHMSPTDPEGWLLKEILVHHGVLDRTLFTNAMLRFERLPDEQLCQVYQSFDVFALPTMGEGFGIPLLEAMSCGIPVVATEGSAVSELLEGRGELIGTVARLAVPPFGYEFHIPDVAALAEALDKLYHSPELRGRCAEAGRDFAVDQTWDLAAEGWLSLIRAHAREPVQRADRPAGSPIEVFRPAWT